MTCLLFLVFAALAVLLVVRGPFPSDWRAKYSGTQAAMFAVAWVLALALCSGVALVAVVGWPS